MFTCPISTLLVGRWERTEWLTRSGIHIFLWLFSTPWCWLFLTLVCSLLFFNPPPSERLFFLLNQTREILLREAKWQSLGVNLGIYKDSQHLEIPVLGTDPIGKFTSEIFSLKTFYFVVLTTQSLHPPVISGKLSSSGLARLINNWISSVGFLFFFFSK